MAICNCGKPARIKWCSPKCRSKAWIDSNPERWAMHQKTYRLKTPIMCKVCNIAITDRKMGKSICSIGCNKIIRKQNAKKRRDDAQKEFSTFKTKNGCVRCGYNKCAASLDFHHTNPQSKDIRITATQWVYKSQTIVNELSKCILVCKNCHYEIHEEIKENGDL